MIDLKCPKCRSRLSVPDSLAGQTETCPSCGNVTFVPKPKPSVFEEETYRMDLDLGAGQQPVAARPAMKPSRKRSSPSREERKKPSNLTKCYKCKAMVPKDANICPKCKAVQPSVIFVSVMAFVGLFALFVWGFGSCSSDAEPKEEPTPSGEYRADSPRPSVGGGQYRADSPRPSVGSGQSQQLWYAGGTLHKGTMGDWKMATYRNKLATAADFVTNANNAMGKQRQTGTRLKASAMDLVAGIDEVAKTNLDDEKVATVAAMILTVAHAKEGDR